MFRFDDGTSDSESASLDELEMDIGIGKLDDEDDDAFELGFLDGFGLDFLDGFGLDLLDEINEEVFEDSMFLAMAMALFTLVSPLACSALLL